MNAPPKPDSFDRALAHELRWSQPVSPFDWQVQIFGGQNPRTGQDQPAMQVQFFKRRPNGSAGYGREGILWRANDYAKAEHRSHFAVRDPDGSVIYQGPVLDELEAPRVFKALLDDAAILKLSKGLKRYRKDFGNG